MPWFKRTNEGTQEGLNSPRYKGRPLLILLENYVLDCIGVLDADAQSRLAGLVQHTFGGDEDWQRTLRATLKWEDTIDDGIRKLWVQNQEIARKGGVTLTPEEFARMIVDANFAPSIEPLR
jgi:hypothetical protein